MNRVVSAVFACVCVFVIVGNGQVNEICSRSEGMPSLGDSYGFAPYVFGKIILSGFDPDAKLPKVTITLSDRTTPGKRVNIDKTGYYCFKRTSAGSEATLIIHVDGAEVARRMVSGMGAAQQREDFEITAGPAQRAAAPGTVSAKYSYPPNTKTEELYKKALEAEKNKNKDQLIKYLKEIVAADPADFIAWARLGSEYLEKKSFPDAESAFRKSIELKAEYVPAMINLGRVYLAQVKSEPAIEVLLKAIAAEPTSARAFQILGNAYLMAKKGSLGVDALNKALELDPAGMADSHLLLATLYDRAGAKDLATKEYKAFVAKRPDHPDKAKFEKYIKDNPEGQ